MGEVRVGNVVRFGFGEGPWLSGEMTTWKRTRRGPLVPLIQKGRVPEQPAPEAPPGEVFRESECNHSPSDVGRKWGGGR